jgi:hypothetical protein
MPKSRSKITRKFIFFYFCHVQTAYIIFYLCYFSGLRFLSTSFFVALWYVFSVFFFLTVMIVGCLLWNLWKFSNQRLIHALYFPRMTLFTLEFSMPTSYFSAKGTMLTNQSSSTTRCRFVFYLLFFFLFLYVCLIFYSNFI